MVSFQISLKSNMVLYTSKDIVKPNFTPAYSRKPENKSVGFHSVSVRRRTYGENPFSMTFHGFVGTRSTQPTILWNGSKSHRSKLIHLLYHVKDVWRINEVYAFRTFYKFVGNAVQCLGNRTGDSG